MLDRLSSGVALLLAAAGVVVAVAQILADVYSYATLSLVLGVAMLAVGGWWLNRQRPGTPFRELAWPAAVATVMPILVGGQAMPPGLGMAPVWAWLLAPAAAATLGLVIADSLPERQRVPVSVATALLGIAGAAFGLLSSTFVFSPPPGVFATLAVLPLAATTAVPGVIAGILRNATSAANAGRGDVVAALELGVIGITPAIAVLTVWDRAGSPIAAIPLLIWIIAVLAGQYLAVRPLARSASVATAQRDMVVAAMEAERARIAADIHDDALQELTLLGWRLESAGDSVSAATVREVADRLRAILGDLRLPILDDLGTGPALEWLVERVGRLAGGEVRLERSDSVRPPADVELAFFRVAQEALSNAIRHGRPPVVVRYWASPSGASLSIDDAGPGLPAARGGSASEPGHENDHFGLLNMRQRAEQIGALLDIRRWPAGGTQVKLDWRP